MNRILLLAALASPPARAADPWEEVAQAADLDVDRVHQLLDGVPMRQSVLDRMARPWEAKPWAQYGPIFLDEARIANGAAFWAAHAATLDRVSAETGVPPQVIVAILGVETRYGEVMGADPVVEALYTLGFFHERRGPYFRKELGTYLRLALDEGWPIRELQGSYAGAMGMGQFMPSSYQKWAVDGDGDGRRDLFGSPDDAIASVAHYLVVHGWERGAPILVPATGSDAALAAAAVTTATKVRPWSELAAAGVGVAGIDPPAAGTLYGFQAENGVEYRVGLRNFWAITRYNHSPLYARAVFELSEAIRARQGGR